MKWQLIYSDEFECGKRCLNTSGYEEAQLINLYIIQWKMKIIL